MLGARWYDQELGRFISADTIVPEPGNPQALNRYSYVYNSPLKYTDPTGHIAQTEQADAEKILKQLALYGVEIAVDWGQRSFLWMSWWENGLWTLSELNTALTGVQDLANAMGGATAFSKNLGGVKISQKDMSHGGLGEAHRVTLNASGFSTWTVVHELAHAWDAYNGWGLSTAMQSALGAGFKNPLGHFFYPNDPAYWYDPGNGPPPAGIDTNFNEKEDFAETVTAFVYPGSASSNATSRGWPYVDPARGYNFARFADTPRGQFVAALMVSNP